MTEQTGEGGGVMARMSMKEKLDVVVAERDALRKALDPTLKHLRFENGEMNMAICGPMIANFGLAFGEWFVKHGARNYVEMTLHGPAGERYVVTCQKVGALSPHEMAEEAKNVLRNALAGAPGWEDYAKEVLQK